MSAALTFNVTGISDGTTATSSAGAGAGVTTTVSHSVIQGVGESNYEGLGSGGTLGMITVTVSGLTIDAVGTGDDSASFSFSVDSGGGTIDDSSGTSGWGVNGNGAGRISAASESLILGFVSGSTTLGAGATEIGTFSFKGFNQVTFSSFDVDGGEDDIATIQFGSGPVTNLTSSSNSFGADAGDVTIGYLSGDATNAGFKLDTFRARVEVDSAAVPEPSSVALLGLGGLALILRRRKQ